VRYSRLLHAELPSSRPGLWDSIFFPPLLLPLFSLDLFFPVMHPGEIPVAIYSHPLPTRSRFPLVDRISARGGYPSFPRDCPGVTSAIIQVLHSMTVPHSPTMVLCRPSLAFINHGTYANRPFTRHPSPVFPKSNSVEVPPRHVLDLTLGILRAACLFPDVAIHLTRPDPVLLSPVSLITSSSFCADSPPVHSYPGSSAPDWAAEQLVN